MVAFTLLVVTLPYSIDRYIIEERERGMPLIPAQAQKLHFLLEFDT